MFEIVYAALSHAYWASRLDRLIEQNQEIETLRKLINARSRYLKESDKFQVVEGEGIEKTESIDEINFNDLGEKFRNQKQSVRPAGML